MHRGLFVFEGRNFYSLDKNSSTSSTLFPAAKQIADGCIAMSVLEYCWTVWICSGLNYNPKLKWSELSYHCKLTYEYYQLWLQVPVLKLFTLYRALLVYYFFRLTPTSFIKVIIYRSALFTLKACILWIPIFHISKIFCSLLPRTPLF